MKLRTLVLAAVAALAILGVAGAATAANANFWTDPAGDGANAADVTRIVAESDDAGNITFTLTYGNRPGGLTENDEVHIWLDSDANPSTGDSYGYDYLIAIAKGAAVLKHSTASGLEDTPSSTFSASADGTSAKVNRSEVGNTAKFAFYVATITTIDNSVDYAPDFGSGVFVFSLSAPKPTQVVVTFAPKAPKSGKSFLATVALVKYDDGSSIVPLSLPLTCKGTLNGKPIRATAIPLACVWKLPKSAKGKRFSFTITVSGHAFGPWMLKVR
jgi:hypothetical protein